MHQYAIQVEGKGMTPSEQTDALYNELVAVITRFQQEFDVTPEQMVGVLEYLKRDVMDEEQVEVVFDSDEELIEDETPEDTEEDGDKEGA